jgi:hypothetical protein
MIFPTTVSTKAPPDRSDAPGAVARPYLNYYITVNWLMGGLGGGDRLRAAESIGRPLGGDRFLARIERLTGRSLKPGKRGPKPTERRGD